MIDVLEHFDINEEASVVTHLHVFYLITLIDNNLLLEEVYYCENLSGANSENPKKVVYENGLFTKRKIGFAIERGLSKILKILIRLCTSQYSPPEPEILHCDSNEEKYESFSSSSDPFADSGDSSYEPSHTEVSSSPPTDSPSDFDIYTPLSDIYTPTTIIQIKTQVQKLIRIK
ncbi:hypothetical protein JTB14_037526 [Gonioctena quinquepunctata]|nr:hypothetical protein JTB14_037526 [Gonioctena quinquepunctata]